MELLVDRRVFPQLVISPCGDNLKGWCDTGNFQKLWASVCTTVKETGCFSYEGREFSHFVHCRQYASHSLAWFGCLINACFQMGIGLFCFRWPSGIFIFSKFTDFGTLILEDSKSSIFPNRCKHSDKKWSCLRKIHSGNKSNLYVYCKFIYVFFSAR